MQRQSRHVIASAAFAAVVALSGAATTPGAAQEATTPTVEIRGTAYTPKEIRIEPGQEVTWKTPTDDPTAHTVTFEKDSEEEQEKSNFIGSGSQLTRRFDEGGEWRYYCRVHEDQGMRGTVLVGDPAPSTTTTKPLPPPPPPTTAPPPPPTTAPPATAPPTTAPPATAPPTTPAPTPTTKPTTAEAAAGKRPKPPKPARTTTTTATTVPEPETTTTVAPAFPSITEQVGPLVPSPGGSTTTTVRVPSEDEGDGEGFVATPENPGGARMRGRAKKAALVALGTLGATLLAAGVVQWRRRSSRYWSA